MYTEEELLVRIQGGDLRGLEKLFRQFYRPLVMYAHQYLTDITEAEDVVQELFTKMWEQDKFSQIQTKLYAYLYNAVRNACLNRLNVRSEIRISGLDLHFNIAEEEVFDEKDWEDYINKVYLEVEKLPVRTREIFKAIVLDGKKYKEVAGDLGISVNTIKTTLKRAFITLRTRLPDDDRLSFLFFFLFFKEF